MTSHGRGRGWAQHKDSALPRPGRPLSPGDVTYTSLFNYINFDDDNEESQQSVEEVRNLLAEDKDNMKNVIYKLYKNSLHDRNFGKKFATVFANSLFYQMRDNENMSARNHILHALQTDYTRRDELRQESVLQFHNMIYLICEFYATLLIDKNRMRVLVKPIIDCLEMLLETPTDKDIILFTELIIAHGQHLFASREQDLDTLMISVKQILIKETLTPALRQMLLYVLDKANMKFNPLPVNLQKFYDSLQIGGNFTQHQNNDLVVNITAKTDNVESVNTLMKATILEDSEKNGQKNYPVSSNNRTLRAIRGSGATDIGKDRKFQGKPHSTKTPPRKQNSNNKGWGHDDRFEKDYE